jgi:molecular chaperone Hsp33
MGFDDTIGTTVPGASRLYTFVDPGVETAVYFLEGQRLIHDLALIHGVNGDGFSYFRDVVLSVQPLMALLKRGEQFGFYVDSEEPYFRLKIESGHLGQTRCALVPDGLDEVPERVRGVVRLVKLFPDNMPPYQSLIRVDGLSLGETVNRVLDESYQIPSRVVLSDHSDQSAMVHHLPGAPSGETSDPLELVEALVARLSEGLAEIFGRAPNDPAAVEAAFADVGYRLLASREVGFHCGCSRERMLRNLALVLRSGTAIDELFEPDRETLDIVCEYCKSDYSIARSDLAGGGDAFALNN